MPLERRLRRYISLAARGKNVKPQFQGVCKGHSRASSARTPRAIAYVLHRHMPRASPHLPLERRSRSSNGLGVASGQSFWEVVSCLTRYLECRFTLAAPRDSVRGDCHHS